jgi:hypothetical protein
MIEPKFTPGHKRYIQRIKREWDSWVVQEVDIEDQEDLWHNCTEDGFESPIEAWNWLSRKESSDEAE